MRPLEEDEDDRRLLSQTYLEQISKNRDFRSVVDFMEDISYLHLVPQMIRTANGTPYKSADIFGTRFMETVAKTPERTRKKYLASIEKALQIAVPQLKELKFTTDERGIPHLEARYNHWRPHAGLQNEMQFSDGTIRLIGILWALLDGSGVILMEEPELSLHTAIVKELAPLIHRAQTHHRHRMRQVLISTHSADLLSDVQIAANEIILFIPSDSGTNISLATSHQGIRSLMENGFSAGEAAIPATEPTNIRQLRLFDL
jgi:predicted ATPase